MREWETLLYLMINIVRAAGVGPALTAWKAAVIPLDHARIILF